MNMRIRAIAIGVLAPALFLPTVQAEERSNPSDSAHQTNTELQELRRLLEAQQNRIEALENELHKLRQPAESSAASASTPAPQETVVEKKVEKLENRLKSLGPFSFSGDLRLRGEPFFGGPADQSQIRSRLRYRLRFNADAKLNDQLSGGFTLASGDVNDPISTNQTTNQFYTRKPFAVDRAYLTYVPKQFKPLTLTGGKFGYPWYNTELTWDKDLNPEGLAQTLGFDVHSVALLRRIALVGFELPFSETTRTTPTNKSVVNSAVYGGQLQTSWQLASWLKLGAYSGFYNWHNTDSIALAISTANAASPANGLLPLQNNRDQNALVVTTGTQVVTVNGVPQPTGVSKIVTAQFASRFGLLDSLARIDIKTASDRWPIALIGDYVENTRACENLPSITPAPANTSSVVYTQSTNAVCDSRQRSAYWLEGRVGRLLQHGDWQFAYTRAFIEREAVLGVFNASDIRQGSNVSQHRAEVLYQAHKNVQLVFSSYIGRPLHKPANEDWLTRLQFDAIYKF